MINENELAPDFTFSVDNKTLSLKEFTGKKVILYFYPKDNTAGCTKEACGFRDNYTAFYDKKIVILGVSPDNDKSHLKFKLNNNLQFNLISDQDHVISILYDVWKEKTMYGRRYMGIVRTTFVIDENGIIVKIFNNVKPEHHAAEILKSLNI